MQSQHRPSIPQSFGELHLIKVDVAIHTNKDKATSIFGDIIFFPQFGGERKTENLAAKTRRI